MQLEGGTAECITNTLNKAITNIFSLKTENCIGLETDNACTMTGINTGIHKKTNGIVESSYSTCEVPLSFISANSQLSMIIYL